MHKGHFFLGILILLFLNIVLYIGHSYWLSVDLDNRSEAFEKYIDTELMKNPDLAGDLYAFIDATIGPHADGVCIVPPYADEVQTGRLTSVDLGGDASWLGGLTEQWTGMVVLDRENDIVQVWRLNSSRFRVVGAGIAALCYARVNQPKIRAETTSSCGDQQVTTCLRKVITSNP